MIDILSFLACNSDLIFLTCNYQNLCRITETVSVRYQETLTSTGPFSLVNGMQHVPFQANL